MEGKEFLKSALYFRGAWICVKGDSRRVWKDYLGPDFQRLYMPLQKCVDIVVLAVGRYQRILSSTVRKWRMNVG